MKFLAVLFYLFIAVNSKNTCDNLPNSTPTPNNCISFTVAQGTGCAWMCNYCANNLGPNYYFTDNVCVYQNSGCVGNPIAGKTYTCCSN
jgi:hypothetical protein